MSEAERHLFGVTKDKSDLPAPRRVTIIRESTGQQIATMISHSISGWYNHTFLSQSEPYSLVFTGEPDRNGLIYSGVVPSLVAGVAPEVVWPPGVIWTPAQADTALWFDGKDVATVILDGANKVQSWHGKDALSRNASQANAALRPTYNESEQGIQYPGGTGGPRLQGTIPASDVKNDFTLAFAARNTGNPTPTDGYHAWIQLAAANLDFVVWRYARSPQFNTEVYYSGSGVHGPNNTYPLADYGRKAIVMTKRGDAITLYMNGVIVASGTRPNISATVDQPFYLGWGTFNNVRTLNGLLFEVVHIPGNAEDPQVLTGYLAHRWSFEDQLAADHPYRNAPPPPE